MQGLGNSVVDKPTKYFDLEKRTFEFAKAVRLFVKKLPRTIGNIEDSKQLIRASGSIGANYIEANESLSRADFEYRIKICRKESKEVTYWIKLIHETNDRLFNEDCTQLIDESLELRKIFAAIHSKIKSGKENMS